MVKLRDISYEEFLELFQDKLNYLLFKQIIPYYQRKYMDEESDEYKDIQHILKYLLKTVYKHNIDKLVNTLQVYAKNYINIYLDNLIIRTSLKDRINFLVNYADGVLYLKEHADNENTIEKRINDAIKEYFTKLFNNYIKIYAYNFIERFIKDYREPEIPDKPLLYNDSYKEYEQLMETNWNLREYIKKYWYLRTKEEWKEYLDKVGKQFIEWKISLTEKWENEEDWKREMLYNYANNPDLFKKLKSLSSCDCYIFTKLRLVWQKYLKDKYGKWVKRYMNKIMKEEVAKVRG